MEQHDVEIGTRRDLVLYRIETSKNDLKSGQMPRILLFLMPYNISIYNIFFKKLKTPKSP